MAPKQHHYRATLEWSDPKGTNKASTHTRDVTARIPGKPDLKMSADAAFRGDPARHNPEDLLVLSLSSCHMLWYLALCGAAGISVTHYVDEPEGVMVEDGMKGGRFERVTLRPRVTIASGDAAKAKELHKEAHRLCFIVSSVNFPVECAAEILAG